MDELEKFLKQQIISSEQQVLSQKQKVQQFEEQLARASSEEQCATVNERIILAEQGVFECLRQQAEYARALAEHAKAKAETAKRTEDAAHPERDGKRARVSEVSVSSFSTAHWDRLSSKAGLKVQLLKLRVDGSRSSVPYQWGAPDERKQTQACLSHLQQLLPLPGDAEQPLTWIDCTNNTNLLTVTNKEDVLDFRSISGTSDIAIVTAASREMSWERKGLCILFELKKPQSMNSKALHQALCQLVLANLVCGELKPVVVLTDLQESWRLLWMAGSTAKVASFTSSAAALAAIDGCIVQASALAAYKQPTCPPGLPLDIAKREPAAFPAGPAVEGDVGNLADLEGFLPDEEVAYARGAALLQRFFADEGACLVQPAPGPAPPGMYA